MQDVESADTCGPISHVPLENRLWLLAEGGRALQRSWKEIEQNFQNRPSRISSLTSETRNSFRLPIAGNDINGKWQHCPVVIKVTIRCSIHADTGTVFYI